METPAASQRGFCVPRRPGAGIFRAYKARDRYHRLRAMGNAQAHISFPFVLAKRERNGRLTGQRKGKALGG